MRVLVVTIVHTPLDARIHHRQIGALREHGVDVCYAAPWSARGVTPPPGLHTVDLPRAQGRRRLPAVRAARRLLRDHAPEFDVVLLHDPDLLLSAAIRPPDATLVWDVHEDTAEALTDRAWLPRPARPATRLAVRGLERWVERRLHLLLAEDRYQTRFRRPHPVVHNYPVVPPETAPPGDGRVVYLGRLADSRGLDDYVRLGDRLRGEVTVQLVGWPDQQVEARLAAAARAGAVQWTGPGYVPNDEALARVDGALAGLALLRDQPNYRHSLPTKVLEYMSRGVPVVTTPLPAAREIVERHDCGYVVPFGDVGAVVDAIETLRAEPDRRVAMGQRGHRAAGQHYDWRTEGERFVEVLRAWAGD